MAQKSITKIKVFGLGALGSNLLVLLARQFPEMEFIGVDFDKVEERNIRPQAYFLEHVRQPKAKVMLILLQRFVRKPRYKGLNEKIVKPIDIPASDTLYIDCFDNTASRKLFPQGDHNILHIGFSPFYSAECLWNKDYKVSGEVPPDAPDICELDEAIFFINNIVTTVASYVIGDFIINGNKHNFIATNKDDIKKI